MGDSNRDLEHKLQAAFDHAVPDVRDQILARVDHAEQESAVVPMDFSVRRRRRPVWGNVVAAAAVFLLAVQFGFYQTREYKEQKVETVIDLDVNPSIELGVNSNDRIASVKAVNKDAENVLSGMELKGTQTKVAVNAILGAMLSQGYISENANSILVSVDNRDDVKSEEIQQQLVENIDTMLQACSVDAAILSQSVKNNDPMVSKAADYDISAGRMSLINKIVANNTAYEVEDLVYLTVNELNMILSADSTAVTDVSSKGTVSEAAYIGMDKAVEIACARNGLTQQEALSFDSFCLKTDVAILNSRMVYAVSYVYKGMQYEYKIDALNGDVAAESFGEPENTAPEQSAGNEEPAPDGENHLPAVSASPDAAGVSGNTVSANHPNGNGDSVSGNEASADPAGEGASAAPIYIDPDTGETVTPSAEASSDPAHENRLEDDDTGIQAEPSAVPSEQPDTPVDNQVDTLVDITESNAE